MRRTLFLLLLAPLMTTPVAGCAWISQTFGAKDAPPPEPTPQQRRQSYVDEHPDLPQEVRDAVLAGALVDGMQGEHVRASLGRPISREAVLPSTPEQGDEQWVFEEVAYGTQTSFEGGQEQRARIFSGVRDTRVRFWSGEVVGVDDLGYATRDELVSRCHAGHQEVCQRVQQLDSRAASAPPVGS